MYCFIAMTSKFSIGSYKILVGDDLKKIELKQNDFYYENNPNPMVGVMFVSIIPPKTLLFPFLAYRLKNEKVVFTLCSKCAEESSKLLCNHSDSERSLKSVYFISELVFALSLGYKLDQIYECHYFEKKIRETEHTYIYCTHALLFHFSSYSCVC